MTRAAWMTKAEAAIRTLRDVDGASVQGEGEDVREIHVLTSSKRPAKQIVRDVQSLLAARFNQTIDHRVVSVAYTDAETGTATRATAAPSPAPVTNGEPAAGDNRIRYVSANLYVSGPRVQAQVELKWRGTMRMGSASGLSTREASHRLVATATLAAVHEFLAEGFVFGLEGIEFVRLGRQNVVAVALELLADRDRKVLVGCCPVGRDRQQAIVLATLTALNRVIGGLPGKEVSH